MDSEVRDLLATLGEEASEVSTALAHKLTELSNRVDYLLSIQDETTKAYQTIILIGNFIQKVSVDGQPLPQDFGIHFANAIQQLVIAQFNALSNARDNKPK